ncbi:MAG: hypothetical protein IT223_10110 [Crocinitomicaceae bacterium]|nr:hypothetical protein [Crocinitomicaceae bacterium]
MKPSRGILFFTVFLFLLAVFHFGLTTIYNFSYLKWPSFLKTVAMRYSAPLFHQNWKMFAPDIAAYHTELEYRAHADSGWSIWQDVSASNGFGPRSRVEYMEQTINSGLAYQIANNVYTRDARRVFDGAVHSFDFRKAAYFTEELYERKTGKRLGDSLQLRVMFRFTPKPGSALSTQKSYLEFPAQKTSR